MRGVRVTTPTRPLARSLFAYGVIRKVDNIIVVNWPLAIRIKEAWTPTNWPTGPKAAA